MMDPGDEICRAAKVCTGRFDACLAGPALKEHVASIRSAQGDFNLWCSAIKATNRGKSSLDYRLRNHQDVREVVCGLLAGLATSLGRWTRQASAIYGDAEPPVNSTEEMPDSPASTDSPASWDAISEGWSNSDSGQDQNAPTDPVMTECMSYVRTTLDQLAKVSLAIRKAGNKYRFEKVDAELDEDIFEEFRNHLTSVILRAFPDPAAPYLSAEEKVKRISDYGALTPIQKRLIHTNILRKHRIEFVTKARKKGKRPIPGVIGLAKDSDRLGETRAPTTSSIAMSQSSSREKSPDSRRSLGPSVSQSVPTPSVVHTEAATATDVGSRLDVNRFLSVQTPSKVTNLTRVGSTQAYPNCPKPDAEGLLICPYCDDVLPSSYTKMERSWKAHVIQDIMPYSCFIDECETPYELYLTAENLLAHMMDKHSTMRWTCNFCSSGNRQTTSSLSHKPRDFWSAEAWEDHVKNVHSDRIKVAQLSVLAELSKQSVIGPLACPLCDFSTDVMDSKIDDHILQHLHEFSLRALPENSDSSPEEESKASQMSGLLSHVNDVEYMDPGPIGYNFTMRWLRAWYTDFWLLQNYPRTPSFASLMTVLRNIATADFSDAAETEFWSFHLLKASIFIPPRFATREGLSRIWTFI
ncbi:hypothetical protein F4861DRAFT_134629 [Xylaria intraflava]|nr:hypothetical protein F4861DRAFT_134629 [Xylaria intraflava]